jgi:N-acetylglutamate synthase-like GNAT family acetyltransferase
MEERESPKVTGISDLTGKIVRVRHAIEADMVFIEERMRKHRFETDDIRYTEFAVATEDGNLIGFGRLKKTGGVYGVGCVVVVEEKRDRGIRELIIKHLIEHAPVDRVYVMTDQRDYFSKLGFVEMKNRTEGYMEELDAICKEGEKENKVLMSCERESCRPPGSL